MFWPALCWFTGHLKPLRERRKSVTICCLCVKFCSMVCTDKRTFFTCEPFNQAGLTITIFQSNCRKKKKALTSSSNLACSEKSFGCLWKAFFVQVICIFCGNGKWWITQHPATVRKNRATFFSCTKLRVRQRNESKETQFLITKVCIKNEKGSNCKDTSFLCMHLCSQDKFWMNLGCFSSSFLH